MELTGLLPVLAWLQIRPWLVASHGTEGPGSSPGPLPPPTLSLGSQDPVYYQGERVNLSCSAPRGEAVTGYRFYRGRGGQTPEELPSPSGAARLELRPETGNQGPYTCQYWRKESGQEIPSTESNKVYITVQAPPAAPTLSLHAPPPVYLPGERVTLRCSAPGSDRVQRYRFYGEHERLIHDEVPAPAGGAGLELVAEMGKAGPFSCAYWTLRSGRHILSERSRPVSLSVQDPPPQPVLSVDPPSGVVSEGLPLLITCIAPGDTRERRFHFYKDGAEIVPGDTGSEISTTEPSTSSMNFSVLSVPRASPSNTGEFTCGYEANMGRRWIPSPRSQAVNITMTAWSLPVPLVAGCGGAATALALLLLLIPLCRKKAAATRRLSTSADISGVNICGVTGGTQPVYVNRPSGAGTGEQYRLFHADSP
ncbi:Fc receptor-like protein 5 [Malaclemys terrapin pileata]|uniref:Fc receptor-like protein 5 n=1 Tax=Malaclemys terrapin pileata TaxID=2991368 RepID=UPI0023A7CC46|nr:Fc receptor-like protein 5 [Malaclemys terrapin pileata]